MLIKTLLNRTCQYKSFVFADTVEPTGKTGPMIVDLYPRKNSKPICSGCLERSSGYDTLGERLFEHVPLRGIPFYFRYRMRRVDCPRCGVRVESVPWSDGKNTLTKAYMQFLASWAKSLSWKEVAVRFGTTWEKVFRSVEYVVEWGLRHRNLDGVDAVGVDEIQWKKGHKYLTLVYQISQGNVRLLWMGRDRTEESFSRFFDMMGEERYKRIKYVCSDMWKAYLKVIKERLPGAVHILDRFHIVANLNKAIDKVRAEEAKKMAADGHTPLLKKTRWLLLKRRENLGEKQEVRLAELLKYNLNSVKAYLLKEDFQGFWSYVSPDWAGKFLDRWMERVMRSNIEPIKKEARSIRKHKQLILNWFRAKKQFSSGVVEGMNTKVKVTMRKSYGFRTYKSIRMALFHALGKLPEPPQTHRFC